MADLHDTNNPIQILLIEDCEGDALLVKHAIAEFPSPVKITIAPDAEEALVLLANPLYQPELIILDLNTPKVDGHAFLVRRPAKETPAVVFTSSANPRDKEAALQSGARDYIVKPFDLDGYAEAVSTMIRKWTRCQSSVSRQSQLRLSTQKN